MGNCCYTDIHKLSAGNDLKIEDIIVENEKRNPFCYFDLKNTEKLLETHQFEHRLNQSDIRKICSELSIDIICLTDPESSAFKFFEALIDKDGLYTQRKLVLCAALTSKGPDQEKIKTIGKYYDFDHNRRLDKSEIIVLLSEIVEVSVKVLPRIAVSEMSTSIDPDTITEEAYLKYTDYLMEAKDSFIEEFLNKIMGKKTSISLDELSIIILQLDLMPLLYSEHVRLILITKMAKIKPYS